MQAPFGSHIHVMEGAFNNILFFRNEHKLIQKRFNQKENTRYIMGSIAMEEYDLLGDSKYRSYMTQVDRALKGFESTAEWADLIAALTKLNRVCFAISGRYTLYQNILIGPAGTPEVSNNSPAYPDQQAPGPVHAPSPALRGPSEGSGDL